MPTAATVNVRTQEAIQVLAVCLYHKEKLILESHREPWMPTAVVRVRASATRMTRTDVRRDVGGGGCVTDFDSPVGGVKLGLAILGRAGNRFRRGPLILSRPVDSEPKSSK